MCEPSKLYRSHAPRPCKRGRGRKSSDPTASRRTPLSMLSRPFCFPTSSRTLHPRQFSRDSPNFPVRLPFLFLSLSPQRAQFCPLFFLIYRTYQNRSLFPLSILNNSNNRRRKVVLAKPREIGSFVERVKINCFILL